MALSEFNSFILFRMVNCESGGECVGRGMKVKRIASHNHLIFWCSDGTFYILMRLLLLLNF